MEWQLVLAYYKGHGGSQSISTVAKRLWVRVPLAFTDSIVYFFRCHKLKKDCTEKKISLSRAVWGRNSLA